MYSIHRYSYKSLFRRLLAGAVDIVLWPVGLINHRRSNAPELKSGEAILVVNLGGIGDVILMEPLIRRIKQLHPDNPLDVLTRSVVTDIISLLPDVRKAIEFPYEASSVAAWRRSWTALRRQVRGRYAAAFDVKGDPFVIILLAVSGIRWRSGFTDGGLGALLHRAKHSRLGMSKTKQNLELIDGNAAVEAPKLTITSDNHSRPQQPVIIMHAGAGEDSKLWPEGQWRELKKLLASDFHVEEMKPEDGTLREAIERIRHADMYVGLDSGLTHAAAALGVPTVCLFSLSHDPAVWTPAGARVLTFTPPEAADLPAAAAYATIKDI